MVLVRPRHLQIIVFRPIFLIGVFGYKSYIDFSNNLDLVNLKDMKDQSVASAVHGSD